MKRILLLLFIFYTLTAYTQQAAEKKLPWDYPVKPGTEAWEQLTNRREAIEVCQIPEDVLSSLSTENLTEICLQYPLLLDVFTPISYERGLDIVFERFNGIRELFKRKDAAKELLRQYQAKMQNLSHLEGNDSDLQKGFFILSIASLELLLSRYHSTEGVQNKLYTEILKQLVDGHEKKLAYADYFQGIEFTNFFSRAHMIGKIDEQNLKQIPQKVFLQRRLDEATERTINELSYQLIKEK